MAKAVKHWLLSWPKEMKRWLLLSVPMRCMEVPINIGCIPTKTLVHQAKLVPVKASWEEKKAYYAQAIAEKEEVTSFLRQKNYHNLADNPHTLSRIGLSEEEAVRKGLNIKVNKLPVAAIPRARTLGNTVGLFKVVVDVDTNQIVGCTLFGPESGEVINSVAMAMKTDQPYTFLRDFVFTHPGMSEALNDLMNFLIEYSLLNSKHSVNPVLRCL